MRIKQVQPWLTQEQLGQVQEEEMGWEEEEEEEGVEQQE